MPDFMQDLDLNEDRDIHLDDANDLALTSGKKNLEQSVAIVAGDAIREFIGSSIQGKTVALLEVRIRNAIDADPQVDSVHSVTVEEFDKRDNSVILSVVAEDNDDFLIEVST